MKRSKHGVLESESGATWTNLKALQVERNGRDRDAQVLTQKQNIRGAMLLRDVTTLLTPILAIMSDMPNNFDVPECQRQRVARAAASAVRAKRLAEGLISFSFLHPPRPRLVCSEELLVRIGFAVRKELPDGIRLNLDIQGELPIIYLDPEQMERAFLNLAWNSRDAMPEGGLISIEARAHIMKPKESQGACGEALQISFIDNGSGMDEATLGRAVQPFYSTKIRGTGLGLAMVEDFVDGMGGQLSLSSEVGMGTKVKLLLPCDGASPAVHDDLPPFQ